ncbi:CHC2 zinc finger domain-containing protein (plasmid) [Paraclostridium ghonii]|uniref:CHC2 zinc finger domain-containing protein n=1 Tax=Paraclostridium ghonii TaxID=29358 RepID=UPI00202CE035|nr:CHC2 zinc finger domain-containing protein [Paeniclostridium ghonii]MCM0166558.1 CHC2 zinc finger domain-containing protein [Paeniclostridium ghonii]
MSNLNLLEAIEVLKGDSDNLIRIIEHYGTDIKNNQCKCPFHKDKNPSMGIKGGHYKCFTASCGASGDLIDFIRNKDGMDTLEATKKAIDILGLPITIEKDKLDKLKEYIEKDKSVHFTDDSFKLDGIYFYKNKDNDPVLARLKYKNKETCKKKFRQANIIDKGDYYSLDFRKDHEKHNLLYNMPMLLKNIHENKEVFIAEGEKDADNMRRLGFVATTCREINSVDDEVLEPLYGGKLVVLNDNDTAGKTHLSNLRKRLIKNVKSFKNLKLKEIIDIGEKADISDFIDAKFKEGLSTKDVRKIILEKVNRTLDECNTLELQQNFKGIYKTFTKTDKEGNTTTERIYLTNFNVESLVRVENIDTDEEMIELVITSNLGEKKTIKGKSNKIFLDPKNFNSFMNMGFYFDGKPKDLNTFKAWVNKYFLLEKRNEYLLTGIRDIDDKKMLITPSGAVLSDGKIDTNYKADNHITQIDYTNTKRLTKEQAIELSKHLFSFNTPKNCYNIVGSLVSNMFNSIYREAKGINVHVTSYVGESGSGKSFTIDNITRPLLGLDNDTLVFSAIMKHGLLRAMNDTYMTTIIDEVKPSQSSEFQRQLLSNTIRSVTGESTVIKGTQNQGIKTYKYNSSLVIAGEEALDETALKNRCNIIWFSCNDMTEEIINHGNYFITKEGKEALKSLGLEIYLYIMNNYNADSLNKVLEAIESDFKQESKIHPRIQSTFNNTILGYITVKHILNSIGGNEINLESSEQVGKLIYQNLKENVLDGEFATKQVYDEILEAIDDLAGSKNGIEEDYHYKTDRTFIKLDIKAIYPILESYYRSRGKQLKIDCKSFIKMLTKSKYVSGDNKEYYKVVKLNGKAKRCYFLNKEALTNLDMPILNPNIEWEEI